MRQVITAEIRSEVNGRFLEASNSLGKAASNSRPGVVEETGFNSEIERFGRMVSICGDSHIVVETSLKAYVAGTRHDVAPRTHSISKLVELLPVRAASQMVDLLRPLVPYDFDVWRGASTYLSDTTYYGVLSELGPQTAADMLEASIRIHEFVVADMREIIPQADSLLEKISIIRGLATIEVIRGGGGAICQRHLPCVSRISTQGGYLTADPVL